MLESLINPKRNEKGPFKMLFIGLLYASLSILFVKWFFSGDRVLYEYSGILVITFCVMFSLPFMYFIIRREEKEGEKIEGFMTTWHIHKDALYSFMWLFLGFLIAFSFWHIVLQDPYLLNAQIETYCAINSPGSFENCVSSYSFSGKAVEITGSSIKLIRFLSILQNNIYVMIFTLIFSLLFGAGAIFILAWNASVIAAAIGIFSKYSVSQIPLGIARYMIHGVPEIAAYFLTALAGGMFGVDVLRNHINERKSLRVLEHVIVLLFLSILILIFAAIIEVYFTPKIFNLF
jgi:uncharacterized membrane protein SpoIIM required for sporulation